MDQKLAIRGCLGAPHIIQPQEGISELLALLEYAVARHLERQCTANAKGSQLLHGQGMRMAEMKCRAHNLR